MKSTGVVRKIDRLGRVVIPKEIRRNLNIREDDSLEVYIEDETIILKKYSLMDRFSRISKIIVDAIYSVTNKNIIITSKDSVIASNNSDYEDYLLPSKYITLLEKREKVIGELKELEFFDDDMYRSNHIVMPIVVNGDLFGSIMMYSIDEEININDRTLMQFILTFLEKNIEE